VLPHLRILFRVQPLFPLRGGRPLHKVKFLIFRNPQDIPVARFTNSSPKAFLSNSYDVLSILRRSCRLVPGFFIRLLPRSCCLRPRSLMPLLHSGPFQRLFPNVRPFRVFCTTLSWSYLLRSCSLRPATSVLWVILLPAAEIPSAVHNSPGSEFSWRRFSCALPLLHDRTPSCRRQPTSFGIDNFLGSVPLALRVALQLDVGPCVASSLFPKISLRPLP
jgi:hypothetical protein